MTTPFSSFAAAASTFAGLVRTVPDDRWDGPGLGEWDLRSLVGHTSRAILTAGSYASTTAKHEDVITPQEYFTRMKAAGAQPGVLERGRQAGADLGADPAAVVDELTERVIAQLADAQDRLIQVIGGLGIRLYSYLPTRTFELAVHCLDIAAATDLPLALPVDVLDEATTLAARIALAVGDGPTVLTALTGRTQLPRSFSVV